MKTDPQGVDRMDGAGARDLIRRSLVGFGIGAGLFLALGIYMNREIGAGWLDNPGPLTVVAIIGGTIAGLIAPLFRSRG